MHVLIADKFPNRGQEAFRSLGLDVDYQPELAAEDIPAALRESGADILVVRSTRVTRDAIEAAPGLGLVIRAGAGVNTIDIDAASRRGVFVANCPGKNAIAVAELTMGLVLALDRQIPDAVADMRAGKWNKKKYGKGNGLFGRTLGLVGLGAIAREVARRARAFGMDVCAYDPFAGGSDIPRVGELDQLLRRSDVVSVHVPYGKSTHHLIGEPQLACMKRGAILVHTARGGVVDDVALAAAVREGHIRAGLDVFEKEPSAAEAEFVGDLREIAGLYGTPHIGASTEQAESAIADEVVRIVTDYCRTGVVHNTVNVVTDRPARWTVVVRHLDRVGVLAGVLAAMREENLNIKEMQNVIFSGNEAASATLTLEREPSTAMIERLGSQPDILAVEIRAVR